MQKKARLATSPSTPQPEQQDGGEMKDIDTTPRGSNIPSDTELLEVMAENTGGDCCPPDVAHGSNEAHTSFGTLNELLGDNERAQSSEREGNCE